MKSESRKSNAERVPKLELRKEGGHQPGPVLDFGLHSGCGIRISDFTRCQTNTGIKISPAAISFQKPTCYAA
jgi:hypothetical protein